MPVDPYLALAVVVPLIIPLLFTLVERQKRQPQDKVTDTAFIEKVTIEFRRIDLIVRLTFIVIALFLTWPFWKVLNNLGNYLHEAQSVEFFFSTQWILWGFPAFFGGMLISGLLAGIGLELYLGKRSDLYRNFSNKIPGVANNDREGVKIIAVFSGILSLSILLISDNYIAVTKAGIEVNNLLSLGSTLYEYTDIKSIEKSNKFVGWQDDVIIRDVYLMKFHNNDMIFSNDSALGSDLPTLRVAMEYISIKSRIPVVTKDIFMKNELPELWIGWRILYYLYHPLEAFQE